MKKALFLLFILASFNLKGQDIHFTQFDMSPLTLNSGLTGMFNGDIRFAANIRNQYATVPVPYSTFSASYDQRLDYRKLNFSGGAMIYSDKAGDAAFSTSQFAPCFSIAKSFTFTDSTLKHSISAGIQPQITQRTIDFNKLRFDRQFVDGTYDPQAGTGENFSSSSFTYFNLASGIDYSLQKSNGNGFNLGMSFSNIIRPKQSFFNNAEVMLYPRISIHTTGAFWFYPRFGLIPGLLYMHQQNYRELIWGSLLRYKVNSSRVNYTAISGGIFVRNKDAVIARVGMDYKYLSAGISYDINYSPLTAATNGYGGWEIAVIYIIQKVKPPLKKKICPVYI